MKKQTKKKLIRSGIAGAIGAAAIGGAAYLMSNKKVRKQVGRIAKDLEKKGEKELDRVLDDVRKARSKAQRKTKKTIKKIKSKSSKIAQK